MRINAVIIAALLSISSLAAPRAQSSLLQKAHEAYNAVVPEILHIEPDEAGQDRR